MFQPIVLCTEVSTLAVSLQDLTVALCPVLSVPVSLLFTACFFFEVGVNIPSDQTENFSGILQLSCDKIK